MATIRDLKTPLETLSESDRFELVREIRQLRREIRPKKTTAPRASPVAKTKKKLSTADIVSSLSSTDTAKLIARLRAQMEGSEK